ncbi:glutamine synthetase [Wolbachia endosymbiont of Brugia malayi]|uniref:glutamine synthetase n=1 Tax=unclassified Wolbachia TaxID=2640676 RepID=UPI00004C9321|nr:MULTISPECIES: glutamine synthetase [unclassified Wolbachia]AAW70864.1 Glutamine synthetase [Wolbachia endosymbiont strain TRS of Brugia malayi]QCB61825.1 glutamine synthetase [Wolbachia endosymbiont of Brugia malayi]QIT36684.1 glutamine synthetase, catalytic domain protein [Wolbachia endosymbiont of Brugia pahangi]
MITLNNLNCCTKFGIELEFYTEGIEREHLFLNSVKNKIALLGFSCKKESSTHQYEIKSGCYNDSNNLIKHFDLAKELLTETAQKLGGNTSFKAKPYLDRAGSALNVHVNLVDSNNSNLFYCNEQKYSDYLIYGIGGLCAMMKEHMSFFAPSDDSYLRFQYPDIHTPTTISWGVNNRTAAIRIPCLGSKCRLEHRVPGADCNLEKVLIAIIEGITFGIENKIAPPNRVYGIASDPQYKMENLV